jgi:pachytene checkpoint protein 2
VVNALLTQLDKLRHKKNVLVMSTSNLAKAIGRVNPSSPGVAWIAINSAFYSLDSAFVDRADIVQYVDLPPREAIYTILRTCLMELIKKGIVRPLVSKWTFKVGPTELDVTFPFQDIPTVAQADICSKTTQNSDAVDASTNNRGRSNRVGVKLLELSEKCRVWALA